MDIKFCYRCGSQAVPGTDRCPNCGAFYDGRDNFAQNNYQQYYGQIPHQQGKKTTSTAVVFLIILVIFIVPILVAIIVPAIIGYTSSRKREFLSSEYSNYSEEYEDEDNYYADEYADNYYADESEDTYSDESEYLTDLSGAEFEGTYTDEYGEYERYASEAVYYDIYTDSNTEYITRMRMCYNDDTSSWIKENDLFDSILENQMASVLMGLCDYSWADALDYLDEFSLENGMEETDENGYSYFLDVDSSQISFTVTVPQ